MQLNDLIGEDAVSLASRSKGAVRALETSCDVNPGPAYPLPPLSVYLFLKKAASTAMGVGIVHRSMKTPGPPSCCHPCVLAPRLGGTGTCGLQLP